MQTEKQRERLVEMIKNADNDKNLGCYDLYDLCSKDGGCAEYFADYLMSNNVVVLPCKVGDIVYCLMECSCENIDGVHSECLFYGYGENDRICLLSNGEKCPHQYRVEKCYVSEMNALMFARYLGKTVFLSMEEAEAKLREMRDGT